MEFEYNFSAKVNKYNQTNEYWYMDIFAIAVKINQCLSYFNSFVQMKSLIFCFFSQMGILGPHGPLIICGLQLFVLEFS